MTNPRAPRFSRRALQLVPVLVALLLLSACGSPRRAPVADASGGVRHINDGRLHRVNEGETLYAIAWMYDLDPVALARANNLSEPYNLGRGQFLEVDLRRAGIDSPRVTAAAPAATTTATGVTITPVQGAGGISRAPLGGGLQRTPLPSSTPSPATAVEAPASAVATPPPAREPEPAIAVAPAPVTPAPAPVQVPPPVAAVTPPPAPVAAAPVPVAPAALPAGPVNWAWPSDGRILARFEESSVDKRGIDFAGNKGDPVRAAADGQVVYAGSGLLRYGDLIILKHNDQFLSAYAHNDRILVKEGDFVQQGQRIADLGSSGIDRNMLHFEIRVEGTPVDPLLHLPRR